MKNWIILLLLILFKVDALFASVWDDVNFWNEAYEEKYAEWIRSENVTTTIFSDINSKYYGIHTDCADTAYAFRAIFAFENNLPFSIKNPSGGRKSFYITNRATSFDKISNPEKRLIAFINEIGESVGTESLSHFDTYPISIESINSGSLFLYKIDGKYNTFIRHTYVIRDVNDNGSFDVIYSTQSLKYSKLPLVRNQEKDFEELPFNPWGFRRFRWPNLLNVPTEKLPKELNASLEQYELATKLETHDFFNYVRKKLSTIVENNDQRFIKALQNLCYEAKTRVEYVNQGVLYNEEIKHRCMNYDEYDSYSTPVKDSMLKNAFKKVAYFYNESLKDGSFEKIPFSFLHFYEIIYENSLDNREELKKFCEIKYAQNYSIDLADLYQRVNADSISSHPNDSLEARWGEDGPRTNCKTWY